MCTSVYKNFSHLLAVLEAVLHRLQSFHDLRFGGRLVFLVLESHFQQRQQKLDRLRLQRLKTKPTTLS